eukprot:5274611-Prymnesium_polylepis.1
MCASPPPTPVSSGASPTQHAAAPRAPPRACKPQPVEHTPASRAPTKAATQRACPARRSRRQLRVPIDKLLEELGARLDAALDDRAAARRRLDEHARLLRLLDLLERPDALRPTI